MQESENKGVARRATMEVIENKGRASDREPSEFVRVETSKYEKESSHAASPLADRGKQDAEDWGSLVTDHHREFVWGSSEARTDESQNVKNSPTSRQFS
jgi:hypothetical protein